MIKIVALFITVCLSRIYCNCMFHSQMCWAHLNIISDNDKTILYLVRSCSPMVDD